MIMFYGTRLETWMPSSSCDLVKDVHRLARLGVRFIDSNSGGVSVHPSSESSLVVEVKKGHHLYLVLMELKDSVLVKMNVFYFGR